MKKKYYVCKIIGDGLTPETAWRPAIADVTDPVTGFKAFNYSVAIAGDPAVSGLDWCLVIAAGDKHDLAEGNEDIDALPEYALDVKVSAMDAKTKGVMGQKLVARGIDTSFVSQADGFRNVVSALGKLHDPLFNENKFDVAE